MQDNQVQRNIFFYYNIFLGFFLASNQNKFSLLYKYINTGPDAYQSFICNISLEWENAF